MKTTFLRQETDDKLILQALLYEPDEKTDKLVLHIHGMSGNMYENKFLDFMAKTFTKNGWAFLTPNTRGHDYIADIPIIGNEEKFERRGMMFERFEESVLDIKAFMDFAEKSGYKEIILQGHSLGCSKVVYYYHKTKDKRIRKIVLASLSDMVGYGIRGDKDGKIVEFSKYLVSQGKENEILPELYDNWAYISAGTMLDFSIPGNPIDVFNIRDPKSPSPALESIDVPTLAFMGSGKDSYITDTPDESLEITKSKAKNAKQFDTVVVNNAPHSYFGHEQEVADLILSWISKY